MELVLIRGLPGTGKSTLARTMGTTHVHYEEDMYFSCKDGSSEVGNVLRYIFDNSKLMDAHNWCMEATRKSLNEGKCVVVSNTFVKISQMLPYAQIAKEVGADLKVIECHELYGTKKNYPLKVIFKLRQEWEELDASTDVA